MTMDKKSAARLGGIQKGINAKRRGEMTFENTTNPELGCACVDSDTVTKQKKSPSAMTLMKRSEGYLKEPYSRVIIPDPESGTFTAQILEFPGCIAQGDTVEEAYAQLELAADSWIQVAIDQRQEIPRPFVNHEYSALPK